MWRVGKKKQKTAPILIYIYRYIYIVIHIYIYTDIIYIYIHIETRVSLVIKLIKYQFPVDERNHPASGVLPAGPRAIGGLPGSSFSNWIVE